MNDIKMMIVTTGSEWKKIMGRMVADLPAEVHFSEALILEEMMTEEGIRVLPIPLAPKADDEIFKIKRECIVVEPFRPSREAANIFTRATSSLVIPDILGQ